MPPVPAPRNRRKSKRWAVRAKDIAWKLAAGLVAYGMWLAVIEEKQLLSQLEIPIRFENLDPGLALVGERPSSITVQVQASERITEELRPIDVVARIDLSGFRDGTHTFRLLRTSASDSSDSAPAIVPRRVGVSVVNAFPPTATLTIEPKLTKDVPLRAIVVGEPISGFEMTELTVRPNRVRVVGPESSITEITEAVTKEISLDGHRTSFEQEVWIDVKNPDVILSELNARVSITISEKVAERTFERIAVAPLRGGAYEATLRPELANIRIRGPERLLSLMTDADVMPYVDLAGLQPATEIYQLEVQVAFSKQQFRERIEVLDISQSEVAVTIVVGVTETTEKTTTHGG